VKDDDVWAQLKNVYDPEIPVNIVDLGLVYDLILGKSESGGTTVNFKMTLTAPGCGMGPTIAADARSRLDAMAAQLTTAVNAVHTTGYTFTGNSVPGVAAGNFFTPGTMGNPITAATIAVNSAILSDPLRIAASGNANGPTDNSVAQGLAGLRIADDTVSWTSSTGAPESGSFLSFFRSMITRIGIDAAAATDNATVYRSLADQSDARRQSVSGVSTDEELVNMMRVQQSYQAATKMIKVADDMMQTLLSLV
jgi:flagellar hook-associated protein 1 FlgK